MKNVLFAVVALLCTVVLASCALLPSGADGVAYHNDDQQAEARMEQIADAVNSRDTAALEGLFSTRALEQATDIDQGMDYLLSFFPNGGLTWERDAVGAEEDSANGKKTELLEAHYKVSADGNDFWLIFKDFTVNETTDPDNVGLYALGVAPWSESPQSGVAKPLFAWAGSIHIDATGEDGYPGIYVPE